MRTRASLADNANNQQLPVPTNQGRVSNVSDVSNSSSPNIGKSVLRRSSITKKASFSNLRNYPSNHHPVGIAIWLVQRISQYRNDSVQKTQIDTEIGDTIEVAQGPESNSESISKFGPDEARLRAQRDRKSKQRAENWAKSKFN